MGLSRRQFVSSALSLGLAAAGGAMAAGRVNRPRWLSADGRIRIGLLWSLTGALAVIEKPSRDVALFWADQVNRSGGIAGFEVEPVVVDASSDMGAYRSGVTRLIDGEQVLAVFGGYTTVSRRAIMPLITLRDHLLYYPTVYEGRECWQHIICTGALANQHSYDLIPYMVEQFGPRVYFVGSNYIFPKESNRNARNWLRRVDGELVGEAYMPLGLGNFAPILADIRARRPDWIFSTVVGDSDVYFRRQYIEAGFAPDSLPTASLTTSEAEVKAMGVQYGEGHYCAATYFQSIESAANRRFVDDFLASPFGGSGVTQANMQCTYLSLLLFQKAVEQIVAGEGVMALSPVRLREATAGMALTAAESPQGPIRVDADNFNAWVSTRIGRFDGRGQVDILYDPGVLVAPKPFLLYPDRGRCRADGLHLPDGKIVRAAS